MPRTRSLAWSELKLGVLTMVAIIVAAATIFSVMGSKGFFWQRYTLKTRFSNAAGLKSGAPVRLAGVEVGSVTAVTVDGEQVDITFQVNKDYRNQITTASIAQLGSVSLLGQGSVDISASTSGTPIPDNGYVRAAPPPPQFSDITATANKGIEDISALVRDVRSGMGTVGKLMTDEQLYNEMQRFAATAGDLARSIREGRGTIGRLVNDRKTAD